MPKFFIMSDIHGFYDEMKLALDEAGFDPNNEEHWIVTCGDHFDRGSQPEQVMNYLMFLERWIGIKGNHEELLTECVDRGYWYGHDISNIKKAKQSISRKDCFAISLLSTENF